MSGFYVGNPAFLEASSDGVYPYSAANLSARESCQELKVFHYYIDDNENIKLHTNHERFKNPQTSHSFGRCLSTFLQSLFFF